MRSKIHFVCESTATFRNGQIKFISKNIKEIVKGGKMLSFEHSFNSVESGNKKVICSYIYLRFDSSYFFIFFI